MAQDAMYIQWYPGHMTKTRRQMTEDLKLVDAVCEIVDARIPAASRNPDIAAICGAKPRMLLLNRMDLADPAATGRWETFFRSRGMMTLATDCKSRKGIAGFEPTVRRLLEEKLARDAARGMNRPVKVMVVGIPNVGKSTFINQVSGRKGAKAENRPGVTRGKQWVTAGRGLQLLDTPGILWPKFEDPNAGMLLAYTGAIKEDIMDLEELGAHFMTLLWQRYPQILENRYGLELDSQETGYRLLEKAGRKRGMLLSRGEIDTQRMARVVLDEFRAGKLGRLTLEDPEEAE